MLATKTLLAIANAIEADQGSTYRGLLQTLLPKASDAYNQKEETFRSHLGVSMIGKECSRELWYKFHWARAVKHGARLLRLFNRGHLEEPRMVAALMNIGCQVYQYDQNGNQFRMSQVGGHYGSALDGVARGVPDIPFGKPCLTEFKTHNKASYDKLVKEGMQASKPEHYIQMQTYMNEFNLEYGLYLATCKDNDDLYGEILTLDKEVAIKHIKRAEFIIYSQNPPAKISENAGFFGCKFCDMKPICHGKDVPAKNCRTCINSQPIEEGLWRCNVDETILTKAKQLEACPQYILHPLIKAPL
jgi:hypothetical protein